MQDTRDRTRIAHLFLEIYRLRLGADKHAPAEVVALNADREGPETTYEIRLQHNGRCSSRRITLGPIGEGTGSKSRCFKVIFDELLVVKIPPRPVTTIEDYLAVVRREKRIAEQLAPQIKSSASGIAAMLKHIPATGYDACLDPQEFDKRCNEWLTQSPKLARNLMIGDSFVFFMDLLNHPFLSQHLRAIHGIDADIANEIRHYNRVLLDLESFEGRYGDGAIDTFVGMHEVFGDCDTLIRHLVEQHGVQNQVTPFMRRAWFFNAITGQQRIPERASLPAPFCAAIEELLAAKSVQHAEAIDDYRRTVRQFLLRQTVSQNTLPMEGIVVNLLDLLACVEDKGIAIRDLKPDNIFVAGDLTAALLQIQEEERAEREGGAGRLAGGSPALGLIDFETAVCYRPEPGRALPQPLLGGTLSYASPSHFFKNELLQRLFDDLPQLLHLQDWHATAAIVYLVVTGDMLFRGSKRLLGPMLQSARRAGHGAALLDVFCQGNQRYWEHAAEEFYAKVEHFGTLLEAVAIHIPENARRLLRRMARRILAGAPNRLEHYLAANSPPQEAHALRKVAAAPLTAIRKYRQTLVAAGGRQSERRTTLARQMAWLVYWKQAEQGVRHSLQALDNGAALLSSGDLLRLLFGAVLLGMSPERSTPPTSS